MNPKRIVAALVLTLAIPWTLFSLYLLGYEVVDYVRTGVREMRGYIVMFAIPTVAGAYCIVWAVMVQRRTPSSQPPTLPANQSSNPANRWFLPAALFIGLSFILPFVGVPHPYQMVLGLVAAVVAFLLQRSAKPNPQPEKPQTKDTP